MRPGARAAVLDFNRPPAASKTAFLQRQYLRRLVVPTARLFGLPEQYAYLEQSLLRFPSGPEQERLAAAAGFSHARHRLLAAGQMAILQLVA